MATTTAHETSPNCCDRVCKNVQEVFAGFDIGLLCKHIVNPLRKSIQSALRTSSVAVLGGYLCDRNWVSCISGHGGCAGGRLRSKSGVPEVSFSLLAFTSR